ncbi:hypothetical protein V8B97DRAFT_1967337 [Scleroderma yunnanense]
MTVTSHPFPTGTSSKYRFATGATMDSTTEFLTICPSVQQKIWLNTEFRGNADQIDFIVGDIGTTNTGQSLDFTNGYIFLHVTALIVEVRGLTINFA